ncbi:MAG TPA: dihydrofolate reductase family protein [Lapillicoccus sp.]|nr:dihydrofolate reductase family protein [Lapillicoccus sp.]
MGSVVFDISMSVDGFITAAGRTPEQPTGPGGERLTEWAFGADERNRAYLAENVAQLGAVIAGRETYDTSLPWWGKDGPSGDARAPVFVVTHRGDDATPDGGVYELVTGGLEDALKRAQKAAGDQTVCIMGGADLGRQYIAAGLVDELSLHVVPVLLGAGTPLFTQLSPDHIHLELVHSLETPDAVHLRYRVLDTDDRRTP